MKRQNKEVDDNNKFVPSHYSSYGDTKKDAVWNLLDKDNTLLPKDLCRILQLDAKRQIPYVRNLRSDWKYNSKNRQRLKCPTSQHGCRGYTFVPKDLDREEAVRKGWTQTKAKNHYLLWKNGDGRLEWFLNARVNVHVRSPASRGKACGLLARGFLWTRLLDDDEFQKVVDSFCWRGSHDVFYTGSRLPEVTIDYYKDKDGIIIKLGDRTHRKSVEVISSLNDWNFRMENQLSNLSEEHEDFDTHLIAGGVSDVELKQMVYILAMNMKKQAEPLTKRLHNEIMWVIHSILRWQKGKLKSIAVILNREIIYKDGEVCLKPALISHQ